MNRSFRTRTLNAVRAIFKVPFLERTLTSFTRGKKADHLMCKLVPNSYQYTDPSWRTTNRNGLKFKVNVADMVGWYHYFGFREIEQEAMYERVKPKSTILDVGTNIGLVALHMEQLSQGGIVHAFEPFHENHELASANFKRQNHQPNIILNNFGLGDKREVLSMASPVDHNAGMTRVNSSGPPACNFITMDDYVHENGLETVDLIKIDVEGYELKVLRGGKKTLTTFKPDLFVELNHAHLSTYGDSSAELTSFLEELGYTIFRAMDLSPVDASMDLSKEHLDILAIANNR